MIKFKKMTTTAKVVSGVGVAAVAGVALLPVINEIVPNDKSKVKYFEYKGTLYKNHEDAVVARNKFAAMSQLVDIVDGSTKATPNVDVKPLMAEFVSFISKLFVIKVFQMDSDSQTVNHFQYDGLSPDESKALLQKEIDGQIKYGDLKDITSLVKYAQADGDKNGWIFTPMDELLISAMGDGTGQAYTESELKYAAFNDAIAKLKQQFSETYKTMASSFLSTGGKSISYDLINGLTRDRAKVLTAADHEKQLYASNGDGSGNTYTVDFIQKYQQWGTLKAKFEAAKINKEDFISDNNIKPEMKQPFEDVVRFNAELGWNNKERFSTDEVKLRDLIAKVQSEQAQLDAYISPSTKQGYTPNKAAMSVINIVSGWNWAATGDGTGNFYTDWQLQLAKDIQNREKLMNVEGVLPAPDGAIEGENTKPTGDGTGNTYDQSVFDLKAELAKTHQTIDQLQQQITTLINSKTVAAPIGGQPGAKGAHVDPKGLGDGVDHTDSFDTYTEYIKLKDALEAAQKAQEAFEQKLKIMTSDITPGIQGGVHTITELLNGMIDFDKAQQGPNYEKNYDQDQVDLAKARELKNLLDQQIKELVGNGIIAAPDGASVDNSAGDGDKSGNTYSFEQIQLRDKLKEQHQLVQQLAASSGKGIRQASDHGMLSPTGIHEDQVGLGDNRQYPPEFVDAVTKYQEFQARLQDAQNKLKAITDRYPGGLKDPDHGVSFQDLHDHYAVGGQKNTPEQYTKTEVDQKAAKDKLKSLQEDLKAIIARRDAADAKAKATETDREYGMRNGQLQADAQNFGTSGAPQLGPNVYGQGDQSGNTYDADDRAYTDALAALKKAFPNGNPWWTPTPTESANSDEAFKSLYNDWVNAINKHTEKDNTKLLGDGTKHTFENDKYAIFDQFFRATVTEWHASAGTPGSKGSEINTALGTILTYFLNHGSLTPDGGFPSYTDQNNGGSLTKTGDGSGHSYMKIDDILSDMQKAYIGIGGKSSESYLAKLNMYSTMYRDYSTAALNRQDYKDKADGYQRQIDDYNTEVKRLQGISDGIATESTNFQIGNHRYDQFNLNQFPMFKGKNINPDQVEALAKLSASDNLAAGFTQQQIADLNELASLPSQIAAAASLAKSAGEKLNAHKTADAAFYQKWIELGRPKVGGIIYGPNNLPTGIGDGNWYSHEQINARKAIEELKGIIQTIKLADSNIKISLDDEITKLLNMKDNSKVGVNGTPSSGNPHGDQTGREWADWEITLMPKVLALQTAVTAAGGINNVAPLNAVYGPNSGGTGDKTGHDYSEYKDGFDWAGLINSKIPEFNNDISYLQSCNDALQKLRDKQTRLQKMKNAIGPTLDPTKFFKLPFGIVLALSDFAGANDWAEVIDQAKKWLPHYQSWQAGVTEKADIDKRFAEAELKRKNYIKDNADNLKTWNAEMKKQMDFYNAYSPENIATAKRNMNFYQNQLNSEDNIIKAWWNTHKGKQVDNDQTDSIFAGVTISNDWDTFIETKVVRGHSGSFASIYRKMKNRGANLDGSENIKPAEKYSPEDIKLRDALKVFVHIPDSMPTQTTSEIATYAFNSLFMLYKNALQHGKPDSSLGWKPTSKINGEFKVGSSKDTLTINGQKIGLYKTATFKNGKNDHTDLINDFQSFLWQYLQADTLQINAQATGNGKDEHFNNKGDEHLFSDGTNPIRTQSDIDGSTLGAAAKKVRDLFGKAKIMGTLAKIGPNPKTVGDNSPNDYSKNDMDFYQACLDVINKNKEISDQQDIINKLEPTDGSFLTLPPDGWKGTPNGSNIHLEKVGDGSGNTYTQEVIDDVKLYYAYQEKINDVNAEIAAAEKAFSASDEKFRTIVEKDGTKTVATYDTVKATKIIPAENLNHETWWTQEELDYEGVNLQSAAATAFIKGQLKTGASLSGDQISAGGIDPSMFKVTPAPDGAHQGINHAPTGNGIDKHYDQDQVDKRDDLKHLNSLRDKLVPKLAVLEQKIKDAGVDVAPDGAKAFGPTETWHKVAVGDGTGRYYGKDIFDAKADREEYKVKIEDAQKAFDKFIHDHGQSAIDTILDEIKRGMVSGVNTEEQYSAEQIALRDHTAKIGTENDHLGTINHGDDYDILQTLTSDSIPGENKLKRGIGDDHKYNDVQIQLRDLIAKIKREEADHGIKSEQDIAKVQAEQKFDATKTKDELSQPVEKTTLYSYKDFFNNIDLDNAAIGFNHKATGDESNAFYTAAQFSAFSSDVALQKQKDMDQAEVDKLKAAGVSPAPSWGKVVTQDELDAAKKANPADPSLVGYVAGEHKLPHGDGSGKTYDQNYLDLASAYVQLRIDYDSSKTSYDNFINDNQNLVEFFKFKTINGKEWNPIQGRNWTDASFKLKNLIDARTKLGVGRTMVNSVSDNPSQFGVNRGQMGGDPSHSKNWVMYEGAKPKDAFGNIHLNADDMLGSDRARIGYVLDPSGSTLIDDDAPVFESLKSVAKYLENHPELVSDDLMKKFALLENVQVDENENEITEATVSKDTFRAMEENYKWGDE